MLKHLHKIIICLILLTSFILPISTAEETNPAEQSTNLIQNDVRVDDANIDPINTTKVKKEVAVDTTKEGKKVLSYFLKVMSIVLISSFLIYIILAFIKKFNNSSFSVMENDEYEDLNLQTPESKDEIIKGFLNRTK